MQIYHVVEQRNFPPIEADYFKSGYLSSLDETDRKNLEEIVQMLESTLPSGTTILAVGGTVTDSRAIRYHKDMDIAILCGPEHIPILSKIVADLLSSLKEFKVEGRYAGGLTSRLTHSIRKIIPESFPLNYFTVAPSTKRRGKPIDVFISPIPPDEYFERAKLPYVKLN
ncbi:MAG: hypothetical protein AABX25_04275 [Nanoarchaeota archaeon]